MPDLSQQADPLDGFRGRNPGLHGELEEEVEAFRALADTPINRQLLGLVLKREKLEGELQHESSSMRALANRAMQRLDEACKVWRKEGDPASLASRNAHRDARAADLVLEWIDEVVSLGHQAEAQRIAEDEEELDYE